MTRPQVELQSKLEFSYHRNQSFKQDQYAPGWELCSGWDLLCRAITKVAWSSCIWSRHINPDSVNPWVMRGYKGYPYRHQDHFLYSDYMALDIDDGATIEDVADSFRDSAFIIGTTKSHRKEKTTDSGLVKPACDRFRVIVPWERRITDVNEFRSSMRYYGKKFDADKSKLNGGMFFWPCREIIMRQDPHPDLELASITAPEPPREYQVRTDAITGNQVLQRHMVEFLTLGKTFGSGRNSSCYITARTLADGGIPIEQAYAVISKAPFDRAGFSDQELRTAINSAYRGES